MITGVTFGLRLRPLLCGGGSYPAGGDPLRLVLRLPHRRQQLDAGVLQLIVDDHVVEELTEVRLDLPGGFFHLLEVFILSEETNVLIQYLCCVIISLSPFLFSFYLICFILI